MTHLAVRDSQVDWCLTDEQSSEALQPCHALSLGGSKCTIQQCLAFRFLASAGNTELLFKNFVATHSRSNSWASAEQLVLLYP